MSQNKAPKKPLCYPVSHPKDMPREKIHEKGAQNLTDAELLAVLLRTGVKGRNVLKFSADILKKFPLRKLMQLSYSDLIEISGLGQSKAALLVSCFELARRAFGEGMGVLPVIKRPKDAVFLAGDIIKSKKENLVGFYLNGRNQVIHRETLSIGSLDASIVHPREVFQPAVQHHASSVLLVHNHPSGDSRPSNADKDITKRLAKSADILGIRLMDHVVVAQENYTSLKETGIIQ